MELISLASSKYILGVIGTYEINLGRFAKIEDLNIKRLDQALLMVGLKNTIKDKKVADLTDAEIWKLDLAKKLNDDIIIVGNLSNSLNKKDIEYFKKLFLKLQTNYQKKIIVIDHNVEIFFNLSKKLVVFKNNEIVYETTDYFDDKLYQYTLMPQIVDFIKYVNKDKKILTENFEEYELIKDIYRSVS